MTIVEGTHTRLRSMGPGGLRWEHVVEGEAVYQEGTFTVLRLGGQYRAVFLSPKDGTTLRVVDLVEQKGPPPPELSPCEDRLVQWFRGKDASLAAVCNVLD